MCAVGHARAQDVPPASGPSSTQTEATAPSTDAASPPAPGGAQTAGTPAATPTTEGAPATPATPATEGAPATAAPPATEGASATAAVPPAADPAAAPPPPAEPPSAAARDFTRFGAILDAGAPDGVGIWGVFRPWKFFRAQLGTSTNGISPSIRVGASVAFYFPVTPSLNVEAGHFFIGNANRLLRVTSNNPNVDLPMLRRVNYQYASALLGLEFGSPKWFTFFLKVGVTYVQTQVRGLQTFFQEITVDPSIEATPMALRFTTPSVKLGFTVYFK
jgi:hypothetical protein